jgi:carboxyl-terminal processing protease
MRLRNAALFASIITVLGLLASCQKGVTDKTPDTATTQTTSLPDAQLKDSTLIYTRDLYLWYNQIPSSFNPQTYADPNAIMTAIRAYSIEPGYSTAVDRWSYAMKKSEWDNLSIGLGSTTANNNNDFGLNVFFRTEGDLRVKYVERESPAGLAGIRRGWRITKINGNTNIATTNSDFIVTNVYESTSSTFTFQKPDGSVTDITLTAKSYQHQPVLLDSVYTTGSKKTGYLVFNSFLGDTTTIYNDFQRVFNRFSQQQVSDVIIDLRYNGGGYVTVQQKLANYLINSSNTGQVMMSEQFNDKNTRYNNTARFSKLGSVNVSRVSFIVSSNTASASELLINNLKPYMDVRLVGPSKTHGKPVGFFPVPVGDWYIFPVSFRSLNKNNEGNYFNGLQVNNVVADGLDKDWGDKNESALGFILNGITNGTYRTGSDVIDPNIEATNDKLSGHQFKGTIDTRGMF